jgi:hypothetical protein
MMGATFRIVALLPSPYFSPGFVARPVRCRAQQGFRLEGRGMYLRSFAGTASRLASLRLRLRGERPETRKCCWVLCIAGRSRKLRSTGGTVISSMVTIEHRVPWPSAERIRCPARPFAHGFPSERRGGCGRPGLDWTVPGCNPTFESKMGSSFPAFLAYTLHIRASEPQPPSRTDLSTPSSSFDVGSTTRQWVRITSLCPRNSFMRQRGRPASRFSTLGAALGSNTDHATIKGQELTVRTCPPPIWP